MSQNLTVSRDGDTQQLMAWDDLYHNFIIVFD